MKPLQQIYWLRLALGVVAALICITYLMVSGSIPANVISNPSLEAASEAASPTSWSRSQNNTEWSTSYARTGARSARITVTETDAEWRSGANSVQGGSAYLVYGFFGGIVRSGKFFLTATWYSDAEGNTQLSERNISIVAGNYSQWTQIGELATAPNEARSCRIVFRAVNGTGDIRGDDFSVKQPESYTKLMNSLSIALAVYLISYYGVKAKFITKVEKQTKLVTTGIGIYFFAWLVLTVLLYTVLAGA
jgi:hypothetical protein